MVPTQNVDGLEFNKKKKETVYYTQTRESARTRLFVLLHVDDQSLPSRVLSPVAATAVPVAAATARIALSRRRRRLRRRVRRRRR